MLYVIFVLNTTGEVLTQANADTAPHAGDTVYFDHSEDIPYIVMHRELRMSQHPAPFTGEARFTSIVTVFVEEAHEER